jgi:peptide/nickel transport system substrate-binding protein
MGLLKSKILPFFAGVKKAVSGSLSFVFNIFFSRRKKNISDDNAVFDKKLIYSLSKSKIPGPRQLRHLGLVLSRQENRILKFLLLFMILNLAWLGFNYTRSHLKIMPVAGGQYIEGLVGSPLHINPLYSTLNDADGDIGRLIYSSLFKYDGNGELVGDLAEGYEISDDGKKYTVKIRNGVRWHNGEKLSANDVVFTFEAIKNPAYNSPLRPAFNGVEIAEEDEQTVVFSISEKYAPFLGLLTFGILPESVWGEIAPESATLAESNLKPVGSGPFEFKSFVKDKSGSLKSYTLAANKDYYGGKPYLKEIVFKFYADSTEALGALNDNSVDGLSLIAREDENSLIARNSLNLWKLSLPKVKAIFFNQEKNSFLKDAKVRQALSFAAPRAEIIDKIMGGEARPATGPLPDSNFAYNGQLEKYDFNLEKAEALLAGAGWKKETITKEEIEVLAAKRDKATTSKEVLSAEEKKKIEFGAGVWLVREEKPAAKTTAKTTAKESAPPVKSYLSINLTVVDDEENGGIGELIKSSWEKIGVKTKLVKISAKDIQAGAVKPKNYEALLFSQVVGNDPDVYVFWHSSQAAAGGFNLANYKNEEADKMLEEGRLISNREERIADYRKFQEIVNKDAPAVFLFSPYYNYIQNKKIKGFAVKSIAQPADRFAGVNDWYLKTGWRFEW